jgi:heme/copper-type cytochrome/quinol oxidase subunit 2
MNMSEDQSRKSLHVMTYWLFVLAVFGWVIPFSIIFVFKLAEKLGDVGAALSASIGPSLVPLAVTVVLCVIAYFVYRKLFLKM